MAQHNQQTLISEHIRVMKPRAKRTFYPYTGAQPQEQEFFVQPVLRTQARTDPALADMIKKYPLLADIVVRYTLLHKEDVASATTGSSTTGQQHATPSETPSQPLSSQPNPARPQTTEPSAHVQEQPARTHPEPPPPPRSAGSTFRVQPQNKTPASHSEPSHSQSKPQQRQPHRVPSQAQPASTKPNVLPELQITVEDGLPRKRKRQRISDKIGPAFVDMTATYVKSGDVSFVEQTANWQPPQKRRRIVDVDVDQELLIEVDTEPSFSSSPWILAESFSEVQNADAEFPRAKISDGLFPDALNVQ